MSDATFKPILVLDFDGVLHMYMQPWSGPTNIPDGVVPGAFDFLRRVVPHFDVQILSARSKHEGGIDAMRQWLALQLIDEGVMSAQEVADMVNGIKFPTEKPPAWLTIDDRAFMFEGRWPSVESMLAFKPWNKRPRPEPEQNAANA